MTKKHFMGFNPPYSKSVKTKLASILFAANQKKKKKENIKPTKSLTEAPGN